MEPYSLLRYDDLAGNLPRGAIVKITNISRSTVWILGPPGAPAYVVEQLVDGKWESSTSAATEPGDGFLPKQWAPLRPMESVTIMVGPISESATEIRAGLALTTEWHEPTKAHWVITPAVKLVKRGEDYFPEAKPGAQQEEQVLPLR